MEGVIITQKGIYSLYNFVTDNFKEYDLDILNIALIYINILQGRIQGGGGGGGGGHPVHAPLKLDKI